MQLPRKVKTSIAALATAFGMVAPPAAFAGTDAPGAQLWKTQTFDAVIKLEPCPESGVCGEIHWLNPADRKLFDYFGDKARHGGGPVTEDDVKALCGFSPKIDFTRIADNRWQGTMELRGMNMTVNVDATQVAADKMRVDTSKLIIRQSETWTRVEEGDPKYPKCEKPKR